VVSGHHRIALAPSLGQKLFWQDTGRTCVNLEPFQESTASPSVLLEAFKELSEPAVENTPNTSAAEHAREVA
jgi:hypothetical protein